MGGITEFFGWLFGTRTGVLTLLGAGIVIFILIAFLLERKMRKTFFNHQSEEGQGSLDDDESGWSDFDEDNK